MFPRLFEHCQFACLCVAGVGADDGNRTRVICLEGRRSTIELHPRVASTRFACGLLLLACARGWRLCLPIDLAYECGRVVCVLSTHGVVISVTWCFCGCCLTFTVLTRQRWWMRASHGCRRLRGRRGACHETISPGFFVRASMMLVGVRFGRGSCPSTRWIRFLITLSVVLPVFCANGCWWLSCMVEPSRVRVMPVTASVVQ